MSVRLNFFKPLARMLVQSHTRSVSIRLLAALAFGIALVSCGSTQAAERDEAAAQPDAVVMHLLEDHQYSVEPLPQPHTTADAERAAEAAVASFNFLSSGQVQSTTLAAVGSGPRGIQSSPTWIVYLTGVAIPSFGGNGDDSGPGPMIVAIDPKSFEMEWAFQ
jgi:hypothetical protein